MGPNRLVGIVSGLRACARSALLIGTAVLVGCAPPISVSLSPSSSQTIDQSQQLAITATVANNSPGQGVSWSLVGQGSLAGSTASATYTPPTADLTGPVQATVTATSLADTTASASLQITVNPYLQIPDQTFAAGSAGNAYSQTISFTGGTPPFQWSVYNGPVLIGWEGGGLPDGLTLDSSTGAVTGTPTGAGTWFFDATVEDAAGVVADNGFLSIQVNPGGTPGNPVPFLNQPLAPTAVSPGGAGLPLKVSGTGFVPGATVKFNNSTLPTTFVDSEHLNAAVPASDIASPRTAAVTVVNPSPGGGPSNTVYLQVGVPESTTTFANAANSPLQIPEPFEIIADDFNGDGKPDLTVAANVRMYVLLGKGDGTFASAPGSPFRLESPPYADGVTAYPDAITAADFTHSGHQGLAVAEIQNLAAAVLLGKGNGSFAPSSAGFAKFLEFPVPAAVAADLNGDGQLDLTDGISVDLGFGDGAFTHLEILPDPGSASAVGVGDFNGDGSLDLAVTDIATAYSAGGLSVYVGKGDGAFALASGSPIPMGERPSALAVGDFNGDGKLDVAVADYAGDAVTILLGNGDGTFGPPLTVPVGSGPDAIAAGDFNNDGKLDLAVANKGDGTVTLLLGNGDGTFSEAPYSPYPVGQGPSAIGAADFNGDGKLDLAVVNTTSGTVSILLQQ